VAAAGNDSGNLANSVPAAYDEVMAVTALADYDGQPGGSKPPCR
jgi:subtilisin